MHSTLHLHIELYVCMYFIACYFETVIMNYFIWTVTLCILWMNFGKDKCNIFWQANKSILVLCSSTVKEPVSSDSRVSKQTILLHWKHYITGGFKLVSKDLRVALSILYQWIVVIQILIHPYYILWYLF